jgi:hypothetical protein
VVHSLQLGTEVSELASLVVLDVASLLVAPLVLDVSSVEVVVVDPVVDPVDVPSITPPACPHAIAHTRTAHHPTHHLTRSSLPRPDLLARETEAGRRMHLRQLDQ